VASILKAPSTRSKGVVVFTTQERDHVILPSAALAGKISSLKSRWLVGLHHNWHDWAFEYNPLFDFSMAGEGDLREVSGRDVPLVPLDACNFVPPAFARVGGERFWDVLLVGRAVGFKHLPDFLAAIRRLYDDGDRVRVLAVVAMPPYDEADAGSVFYDLRSTYEQMFTPEERETFTLLDLTFDYPFPLDLETLAFLYRSSRVFVHFAEEERRCRVAAYAWASGLPVVARPSVASLLPQSLRCEPLYFGVEKSGDFPSRILDALKAQKAGADTSLGVSYFAPATAARRLVEALRGHLGDPALTLEELAADSLDIRLGRHHGISIGGNRVNQTVDELVRLLAEYERRVRAALGAVDPERVLAARGNPSATMRLEHMTAKGFTLLKRFGRSSR
jgi:hypothetical protein